MEVKRWYMVRKDIEIGAKINGYEFTKEHAKYAGHAVKIMQVKIDEETGEEIGYSRVEWPSVFLCGESSEEYMLRDAKIEKIFNKWYSGAADMSSEKSVSLEPETASSTQTIRGVCFSRKHKKWKAYINVKDFTTKKTRHIHLGTFDTAEEATMKRLQYEVDNNVVKNNPNKNLLERLKAKDKELRTAGVSWKEYIKTGGKY